MSANHGRKYEDGSHESPQCAQSTWRSCPGHPDSLPKHCSLTAWRGPGSSHKPQTASPHGSEGGTGGHSAARGNTMIRGPWNDWLLGGATVPRQCHCRDAPGGHRGVTGHWSRMRATLTMPSQAGNVGRSKTWAMLWVPDSWSENQAQAFCPAWGILPNGSAAGRPKSRAATLGWDLTDTAHSQAGQALPQGHLNEPKTLDQFEKGAPGWQVLHDLHLLAAGGCPKGANPHQAVGVAMWVR